MINTESVYGKFDEIYALMVKQYVKKLYLDISVHSYGGVI